MEGARRSRNALKVATGILASRLVGLVREAVVARFLGVGAYGDVYATAFRTPNILQTLLGEQTLSAAFIPIYSRLLERGRAEDAGRFAGAIFGLLLSVTAALTLVGVLLARPVVAVFAAGYLQDAARIAAGQATVDRFALAVTAVRILFPMVGLLVLSAWSLGVLNSHRRFFLPYFAPVLWNAAIITVVLFAAHSLGAGGGLEDAKRRLLLAVCWGGLLGGALQFLVQLPLVRREMRGFALSLGRRVEGVREALAAFAPVVAGRGVVQLSGYVDQLLATFLAAGAPGAFAWAQRLYLLPIGLFAMSVAAAELPELAREEEKGASELLAERVQRGWRQTAYLTIPAVVGYLAFGWLVVGAIYRRGSFGAEDQWLVYLVLAGFTLGLLPTTFSRLLQNLFYALGDTRFPARVAVQRVGLAAVSGAALMLPLDRVPVLASGGLYLGAVGLALGSALGAWFEVFRLLAGARSRIPELRLPAGSLARMAGGALLAAAGAAGTWWVLPPLPLVVSAVVVVGIYGGVYLLIAEVTEVSERAAWLGR